MKTLLLSVYACDSVVKEMVELRGLEPLTSSMPLTRSPKLSYSPNRARMLADRTYIGN